MTRAADNIARAIPSYIAWLNAQESKIQREQKRLSAQERVAGFFPKRKQAKPVVEAAEDTGESAVNATAKTTTLPTSVQALLATPVSAETGIEDGAALDSEIVELAEAEALTDDELLDDVMTEALSYPRDPNELEEFEDDSHLYEEDDDLDTPPVPADELLNF